MAETTTFNLSIYRYNPEVDSKPYMQAFTVTMAAGSDPMLLTLLERIKAEQDSTLSFRRSCR